VLVHGPSRKDPSKISGKTIDNVTVVAPLGEMGLAQLVARPWLDIRVESAHVWGCAGTLVGTAERYDGTAEAVAFRPLVDLIGLAR
jgi:hypothetical protein